MFDVLGRLLDFPDEGSLAVVLEDEGGTEGIVLKGVNLGLLDDGKSVSSFCNFGCSGKLAAMCRRDCDEDGGRRPELGGVGVAQADLLPTYKQSFSHLRRATNGSDNSMCNNLTWLACCFHQTSKSFCSWTLAFSNKCWTCSISVFMSFR